jgi:hypothetical protein
MKKQIIIADDICELTPEWLRERGMEAVLCDLDNTLVGYGLLAPDETVLGWIRSLKEAGIPLAVISNASKVRVEAFSGPLGLPFTARAGKPGARYLFEAIKDLGVSADRAVMVGDQYFTDVLAAHRAGIRAVLVPPRVKGFLFTLRRWVEIPFIRRQL